MNLYHLILWSLLCFFQFVQAQEPTGTRKDDQTIALLLELSLEELLQVTVVTTSKTEESLNNAPGVMTVLTAKEIRHFGENSLYEVLERVTSVYMPGAYSNAQNQISLRGDLSTVYDNHVLILINGRPVREGATGGHNFPVYLAFPVQLIERLEIIRGPGSVLYGSNAYMGVINIITQSKPQTTVAMKVGSFNTKAVEAYSTFEQGDLKAVGGIKVFKEDGWNFAATDEIGQQGSTPYGEYNRGAYFDLNYKGLALKTLLAHSTQNRWGSVPVWEDREKFAKIDRLFMDLGYEHSFSDSWKTQLYATLNRVSTNNNYTGTDFTKAYGNDVLLEMTHFVNYTQWQWLFGGVINFMSGYANQYNHAHELLASFAPEEHKIEYSAYVQGNYHVSDNLDLILGGQTIKKEQTNSKSVPRLGLVYQFSANTGFKALYGQAYRSSFQVETSSDAPTIRGNPALAPEVISTTDLQLFHNTTDYQFSATYFNSRQKNLITRIPSADKRVSLQDVYVNRNEMSLRGIELQGKWVPSPHWFLSASLTYQTNESDGKKNYSTVPNWMSKLGISYEFDEGSSIGLFNSGFSRPHDVSIKYPQTNHVNPEPKAFNLMTLNLNLNLKKWIGWPITANMYIYNLLDEDIYTSEFSRSRINSLPAKQGRGTYLGLQYDF